LITATAWLLKNLASWGRSRQSTNTSYRAIPLYIQVQTLHPLDYAILVWLGLGALSLLWTQYDTPTLTELRQLLLEPGLFYLILRTQPASITMLRRLIYALLSAATLVAVIGLFLYLRCEVFQVCQAIIEAEAGTRRLASVYGSPNNVALFLGRCIPFALAFMLIIKDNRLVRVASGISLILMLLAVLFTQSAGAYLLGLPVAVIVVVALVYRRRAYLPLAGIIAAGVMFILLLTRISARFASLLDFTTGTNFFRLRVWESALNIIKDYPVTGIGFDQFLYAFRGHYIRPDAIEDRNLSHPHNILLDFWIRQGIAGVIVLLVIQYFFWRELWRTYQAVQDKPLMLVLCIGTMGSMANLIAHGLVDNSVFVFDLAYVFVLLIGIAVHLTNMRFIDETPD
ncbi:MAG: O-antigen ligase family protein, partial [Aggregatilineales bacterium]